MTALFRVPKPVKDGKIKKRPKKGKEMVRIFATRYLNDFRNTPTYCGSHVSTPHASPTFSRKFCPLSRATGSRGWVAACIATGIFRHWCAIDCGK